MTSQQARQALDAELDRASDDLDAANQAANDCEDAVIGAEAEIADLLEQLAEARRTLARERKRLPDLQTRARLAGEAYEVAWNAFNDFEEDDDDAE